MTDYGYSSIVPKDLAFALMTEANYPLELMQETNPGDKFYDTLPESDPDWCNCKRYRAITFGQVFDWFAELGIIITLDPFFTFALRNKIAYTYKISCVFLEEAKMLHYTEENLYKNQGTLGGSFRLTALAAIEEAISFYNFKECKEFHEKSQKDLKRM